MTTNYPIPPEHLAEPLHIGGLRLASRFTLAPLAGYTNVAFRQSVREQGPLGLATTDLVNARAILESSEKTMELLQTVPGDEPLVVQIFGSNADEMVAAAKWLTGQEVPMSRRRAVPPGVARGDCVAAIDVNMGCPVRKVVKGGGGSAMLCDRLNTVELVRRLVEAVKIPITVKMRLGWDDDHWTAPEFAAEFERVGVAAITIHGRTREQGFGGHVKLEGIRAVVSAVSRIPILGNGDVRNLADAERMFRETGCAGIALGRGALLNPWLPAQLHRWLTTGHPGAAPTYHDRLNFMRTHLERLIAWRGEKPGCVQFRKVAAWYSKALRFDRDTHHALMKLEMKAAFDAIWQRLHDAGPPSDYRAMGAAEPSISVPSGPISHW